MNKIFLNAQFLNLSYFGCFYSPLRRGYKSEGKQITIRNVILAHDFHNFKAFSGAQWKLQTEAPPERVSRHFAAIESTPVDIRKQNL